MKNKFNTLRKYIYEYSQKEYMKKTVNGLFRAILEPVISNQRFESFILFRIKEVDDKKSIMQRLSFSGAKILSFNNKLTDFGFEDSQRDKSIWGDTEFVIVVGQRYSAALIWDYSDSANKESSQVCLLFNSKIISDISKVILENSTYDFSDLTLKYAPDRRENMLLNRAINRISEMLNETNEDILFSEEEKKQISLEDDTLKTASIVAEKAKFIAHEVKNNLSIINLYSKILEKRTQNIKSDNETENSILNAIKNITNASENVSNLITDLRCLSTPYITEINIKSVILNVVMQCREKANKANIKISADNLCEDIVETDKTKLECSLINVIYNAIEASKDGGKVVIDCEKTAENIKIYIKNNGEKIPDDIKSKIFDIDFTTKQNGNGLGLAICKNQLQQINGDINLVSSNEKETIFEIVIQSFANN